MSQQTDNSSLTLITSLHSDFKPNRFQTVNSAQSESQVWNITGLKPAGCKDIEITRVFWGE